MKALMYGCLGMALGIVVFRVAAMQLDSNPDASGRPDLCTSIGGPNDPMLLECQLGGETCYVVGKLRGLGMACPHFEVKP